MEINNGCVRVTLPVSPEVEAFLEQSRASVIAAMERRLALELVHIVTEIRDPRPPVSD